MSWIAIGAGAIISILIVTWLVKVIKATLQTALIIATIIFALNFFGYGPGNVVNAVFDLMINAVFGVK
jgi:hypothetical protein